MKKIKKAYYIISIIINIILLPICGSGIIVYMADPEGLPLSLVLAIPCIPLSWLIISIIALLKDMAWYKSVLLSMTSCFFFMGLSFISFDEGYYAAIFLELIALVFLLTDVGISRVNKKDANKKTEMQPLPPYCYKGEWAYEDAAEEYMKMSGISSPDDLTDDDTRQIYRYSMMPVAYYFYWLLKKGFMTGEFYEYAVKDISEEDLENDNIDILGLLEDMDCCLHSDDMLKGASEFSKQYAELNYAGLYSDKLVFDYYDEIKNPEDFFYCVDFSWDACKRMYQKIDKAYENWSALFDYDSEYYEDDETKAQTVYSKRFGKELEVYRSGEKVRNNITDEYINKCIADLDSMDEYQFERLDRNISDDYGDSLRGKVMDKFRAFSVYALEPQNDGDTAYIVSGEADFEEEHGIAFYVRNGIIFSYGYGYQSDDIYSPENIRAYETAANDIEFEKIDDESELLELVNRGKLVEVYLVPLESGGKDDESNIVYLTPLAVREKELLDRKLQAIDTIWKGDLKYKYSVEYYDDEKPFVPKTISVRHDVKQADRVFYFSIKVWY